MNLSLSKSSALMQFKTRELLKNKSFLVGILLPIGFILVYRFGLADLFSDKETRAMGFSLILKMGILFTICMIALMMPATLLAKDKEKHTLRTLMTSSVSGMDYFVSTVIPVVVVTVLSNVVVLLLSGIPLEEVNLLTYFLAIFLATLTTCVIGMIVGIFSKDQMAASNNMVFFMMVLMMVPMFSDMFAGLQTVNQYLYTGILATMTTEIASGNKNPLAMLDWVILVASCLVFFVIFLIVYRKNGFEKD
ncbi:ABC transporter permease subunit [Vagococcus sp. BWB3-3]|uniref:ABC transporter permease subunit n=1 Tax=Vagococcus allomyrinae TaxID=2794353 RepID=A0A940PBD2_9ENTE|nr:ABC transporter permease [Vagococcus allomyrinae]MBP1040326.1 ABC transporter permease subunit [Vagococcus allomyrinae]